MRQGDGVPAKSTIPTPPSQMPATIDVSNNVSKLTNERAALLGSICNFNKTSLRKVANEYHWDKRRWHNDRHKNERYERMLNDHINLSKEDNVWSQSIPKAHYFFYRIVRFYFDRDTCEIHINK